MKYEKKNVYQVQVYVKYTEINILSKFSSDRVTTLLHSINNVLMNFVDKMYGLGSLLILSQMYKYMAQA